MKKKLNVGSKIKQKSARWSFKGKVANNFEEHINNSIPYTNLHMIFLQDFQIFCKTKFSCL